MNKLIFSISILLTLAACSQATSDDLAEYADNRLGVIDNRSNNCVIGPKMPYGSISPSPQTENGGMDGYAPDEPIRGFGQIHVSGTGWGTYGHFLVVPETGVLNTDPEKYQSAHSEDVTKPFYYATNLDDQGVKVEIAPAHYSAIYRFTNHSGKEFSLLFDATQSIATDVVKGMHGRVEGSEASVDAATGTVRLKIDYIGGWPSGVYTLFGVGKVNKKPMEAGVWSGDEIMSEQTKWTVDTVTTVHSGAYMQFGDVDELMLKFAISFTSFDKAEQLLEKEIPDWDFDRVRKEAKQAWNDKFASIKIDTDSQKDKIIFYSSMFRVFTLASDRTLDNPNWDNDKPYWDDNYAFWDTFRSAYPLLMLIDKDAMRANVQALIDRFEHNGDVFDGFIAGRDRYGDQGGNDVDCVLADAYVKGLDGVDWEAAYKILKHNADNRRIGYRDGNTNGDGFLKYRELGWMPENPMSTSQSLEFAYNDYCAAQVAQGLGKTEDAQRYFDRSHKWVELWNPELEDRGFRGFIDAKKENGEFSFFPPSVYGGSWMTILYEATSWTYSYFMPHDFDKLIELMGGKDEFVKRLNYGFENGLIEYVNEPGFLTTRAFTHAGRPDISSKWVHDVMDKGYDLTGFPENDDTGSMSSWYIFCSTGLFPNAGQDYYYLNAPQFKKSVYDLGDGKKLVIKADAGEGKVYIEECRVNGKEWNSPIIHHRDIANGAVVEMKLSTTPTTWGQQ